MFVMIDCALSWQLVGSLDSSRDKNFGPEDDYLLTTVVEPVWGLSFYEATGYQASEGMLGRFAYCKALLK